VKQNIDTNLLPLSEMDSRHPKTMQEIPVGQQERRVSDNPIAELICGPVGA
jgi:hypothetical protein